MPTNKRIIHIVLSDEIAKRFDDFRFNNRIKTESKAGLMLLVAGMHVLSDEYPELKETNEGHEVYSEKEKKIRYGISD